MRLDEARAEVVRHAQRMEADGLTVSTSGNLSVRVGDRVTITPSGVDYDRLTPELVCVCSLSGELVDGPLQPSSELPMHLALYELPGVGAVVHPHSRYATVLSTLVDELPPIHYLIALFGGRVPVVPYAPYGSVELARGVREALAARSGALLANHGSVTVGESLEAAYRRARYLEWLAEVHYLATLGGSPRVLDDAEIERVGARIAHYGQDPSAG